jgi:hypothetical protein
MLHFLSMWLTIDEVLLDYSVISPERQGKGSKGNNSINTADGVMVIVHCIFSHFARPLYEVVLNSNY